ncbi:MAG: histidine kinase [Verrucomicrobiota bacterium]
MRRLLLTFLSLAMFIEPSRAESPALTTVAEVRALQDLSANNGRPLALTGIVTLVDESRNMLVLQDETGALALYPDVPVKPVVPGQRVSFTASTFSPHVSSLPGYPFRPTGREVRELFEAPVNEGPSRLTRMRGWLRPPVTGNYTFWISSDDSSELWLSPGVDPASARRIATVPISGWTDPYAWSRFPSQRSETVNLREGESYYIEALHEQQAQQSHLQVAWEGPGLEQAIIPGRFLVPWREAGVHGPVESDPAARGILREYWIDYAVSSLKPLITSSAGETGLTLGGVRIAPLGEGDWPDPRPYDPRGDLPVENAYRWVDGEGAVRFLAADEGGATIELDISGNRVLVRVARWQGNLPTMRPHLRAKFRGVVEGVRDANEHLKPGLVTSPSELHVTFFDGPNGPPEERVLPLRDPVAAGPGGYFYTRGVVTFSDRVRDQDCIFIQDARNGMFVSQSERRVGDRMKVGQAVQIGGPLLPGRHAPGILPVSIRNIGWQNLPAPAVPSPENPEASYRDGQWTEIEGVARAVNDDGTVLLMGKRVPLLIWIGRTDRNRLESLINSTLRVRGVMALDLFESPALLVPSGSFVGVMEPAPELPATPVPIASLADFAAPGGWAHQVKISGTVIYRNQRGFYLQDGVGGLRVETREEPPPQLGTTVQVVGFPATGESPAELTEAVWQATDASLPVVPAVLDTHNPDPARNGMLVTVEARLLSTKIRGSDQILELQADRQVFEAVLENAEEKMKPNMPGSVLSLTGVCVLDSGSAAATLTRLLLRTPLDATLLHGPPWWTWQRTAIAIGLLLVVLAASVLRIEFLKRRFTRQQASRLAFARGILESQESERRRIAASLHDSLGQNLLAIRSQAHLALQSGTESAGVRLRLEEISNTTVQALNEVREITHDLRPYQLDRLGLSQAIRAITRRMSESHSVSFACHVDEIDGIFDNDSEIHVYRIIQEGINNIVKHSGATEATVVIKNASGHLSISIRDNGHGLDAVGTLSDAGFGLSGIRERAEIMGGTAKIDSAPGQGANLQVQLPLQPPTK